MTAPDGDLAPSSTAKSTFARGASFVAHNVPLSEADHCESTSLPKCAATEYRDRSLAAAYLFAVMWALTLCLHVAVPLLTTTHLTLVDSFFLLAVFVTGAQAIFDLISAVGTVFGAGKSQNGG